MKNKLSKGLGIGLGIGLTLYLSGLYLEHRERVLLLKEREAFGKGNNVSH